MIVQGSIVADVTCSSGASGKFQHVLNRLNTYHVTDHFMLELLAAHREKYKSISYCEKWPMVKHPQYINCFVIRFALLSKGKHISCLKWFKVLSVFEFLYLYPCNAFAFWMHSCTPLCDEITGICWLAIWSSNVITLMEEVIKKHCAIQTAYLYDLIHFVTIWLNQRYQMWDLKSVPWWN